jgi:hypothetical protein
VRRVSSTNWSTAAIKAHAQAFDESVFVERLRQIVAEEHQKG